MAIANLTHVASPETVYFIKELLLIKAFTYHVWMCILVFGLASNTVNIIVFGRIGFRDNVTVTLLFLSLSDLLNLVLRSPLTIAYFMMENHPNHLWSFDPRILRLVLFWPMYVFYDYWRLFDVSVLQNLFGLSQCLRPPGPSQYSLCCSLFH